MQIDTPALDASGLSRFHELRSAAVDAVTKRFQGDPGGPYARFGQRGRDACREDLSFHLEFLRPVLEFGLVQPMVEYLRWLASVLATRGVPADHLALSLDWLSEFFSAEMEGSDATIVVSALKGTKARFIESHDAAPAFYAKMPTPFPECEAFEGALLAGDRRAASLLFDGRLEGGLGLLEAELRMIQPALYAIGRKWQNNQVTVAQEHLATAISQSLMIRGLSASEMQVSNGSRVLLAGVEGNRHSVGLQMVADAFQLAGWDAQFLGADVPTSALLLQVGEWQPDLLALSVSFAQQLHVVKEITARLADSRGAGAPAVIVGGLAINQFDRLADALGADGWSPDAHSAVACASKFVVSARPG